MNIIFPNSVRECVKMQTDNNWSLYTDMPEAYHVDKYLKTLSPRTVLDLGCGVGRASVYFFKKYKWYKTEFYLADGNTCTRRFKGKRKNKGEYYNLESATIDFCRANGLTGFRFYNLEDSDLYHNIKKFDLVYSFLSIGFHWPLSMYLDDLYNTCRPGAYCIFGIRNDEWINPQIDEIDKSKFSIADLKLCPRESRQSVLVLEVL
jgi:SAM-dependent methyltransferase